MQAPFRLEDVLSYYRPIQPDDSQTYTQSILKPLLRSTTAAELVTEYSERRTYPTFDVVYNENAALGGPNLDKIGLYDSIVLKQEFRDLQATAKDPKPLPKQYTAHQQFMARFLSPRTPYNRMLAFHEVGTGKTALYAAVAEMARQVDPTFEIVVLVRNKTLKTKAINDLAFAFTQDHYKRTETDKEYQEYKSRSTAQVAMTPEERNEKLTKDALQRVYHVWLYADFDKYWRANRANIAVLRKRFDHKIIVIDEVHNLKFDRDLKQHAGQVWKSVWELTHYMKESKVLLLSGTTMHDDVSQLTDVINLILPADVKDANNQIVEHHQLSAEDLGDAFFDENGNYLYPEEFKRKFLYGNISYVRALQTARITQRFMDDPTLQGITQYWNLTNHVMPAFGAPPFDMSRIYPLEMSEFQTHAYVQSLFKTSIENWGLQLPAPLQQQLKQVLQLRENNQDGSAAWLDARSATLFTFPQNFAAGVNDAIYAYSPTFNEAMYYNSDTMTLTPAFAKLLGNDLANLRQYSVKYWFVIDELIQHPSQKMFAYLWNVEREGIKLLAALLKHYGFVDMTRNADAWNRPYPNQRGFLLLAGPTTTPELTETNVALFNSDRNVEGSLCQLVIGSSIVGEGVSLMAIRKMFLLSPWWNEATNDQAIGRAIRSWSHNQLPENQRTVDVYRLAAIPQSLTFPVDPTPQKLLSVDLYTYARAQFKDRRIKSIEKLMKEAAVDCVVNRSRNQLPTDTPHSRECHYQDQCTYICSFVPDQLYDLERFYDSHPDDISHMMYTLAYFFSQHSLEDSIDIQGLVQDMLLQLSEEAFTELQIVNIPARRYDDLRSKVDAVLRMPGVPYLCEGGGLCFVQFVSQDRFVLRNAVIQDTDKMYYADATIKRVIAFLQQLFAVKNAYEFTEIQQLFDDNLRVPSIVLARALSECIHKNIEFRNRMNFVNYLRTDRNMYFLVDHPLAANVYSSAFYADNVQPTQQIDTLDRYIQQLQAQRTQFVADIIAQNPAWTAQQKTSVANLLGETIGAQITASSSTQAVAAVAQPREVCSNTTYMSTIQISTEQKSKEDMLETKLAMMKLANATYGCFGIVSQDKFSKRTFSLVRLLRPEMIKLQIPKTNVEPGSAEDELKIDFRSTGRGEQCGTFSVKNNRRDPGKLLLFIFYYYPRVRASHPQNAVTLPFETPQNPQKAQEVACLQVDHTVSRDDTVREFVAFVQTNPIVSEMLVDMYKEIKARELMKEVVSRGEDGWQLIQQQILQVWLDTQQYLTDKPALFDQLQKIYYTRTGGKGQSKKTKPTPATSVPNGRYMMDMSGQLHDPVEYLLSQPLFFDSLFVPTSRVKIELVLSVGQMAIDMISEIVSGLTDEQVRLFAVLMMTFMTPRVMSEEKYCSGMIRWFDENKLLLKQYIVGGRQDE